MWVSRKWFFGNVIFQEMWFLEEILFSGNLTYWEMWFSFEMWLPRKFDFPANVTFPGPAENHGWHWFVNFPKMRLPRKCYFPGIVTSWEVLLPGNCDFLGIVTSQEIWIQSDIYNIDHVCNSAAGPVYGFHIFNLTLRMASGRKSTSPSRASRKVFIARSRFCSSVSSQLSTIW